MKIYKFDLNKFSRATRRFCDTHFKKTTFLDKISMLPRCPKTYCDSIANMC